MVQLQIKVINLFLSSFILSLIFLIIPVLIPSKNLSKQFIYPKYVKLMVSLSFLASLIPTSMLLYLGQESVVSNWNWLNIQTLSINITFKLDFFSLVFISVALFVTWSIIEFSLWYIESDPNMEKFFKYLLLFLITIMVLVSANNLFQLFIGWEGVGIMSFLLIGWWYGRADANTAAIQAVLYNRIGDIGLVTSMAWFSLNLNSIEFQQMFIIYDKIGTIPLIGLLLAATGKSAQFGLHPWLPAAIEGPTPVSALLHSSTMVVAGIFLLVRFYPLIQHNKSILIISLCLGAITTLFTAICALTQNDIKKIIAFSTSSQLGLIIVTIGINQPHLAFLHICIHAFFKAILFMCSGSIIHNLNDEQDIRKIGGLFKSIPFTSSCLIIGSLALTGIPFLTGFYSKDLIIESANTSYLNAWALIITLLATSLTAAYSTRIIFYVLLRHPRYNPISTIHENNPYLIKSIKRLAMGSIFAGFIMFNIITPINVPQMTIPYYIKFSAIVITALGFIIAIELNFLTHYTKSKYSSKSSAFSNILGYFPHTIHRLPTKTKLLIDQNLASSIIDLIWIEKAMPKSISNHQLTASNITSNQIGLIKLYFLSFLISLILALFIIF